MDDKGNLLGALVMILWVAAVVALIVEIMVRFNTGAWPHFTLAAYFSPPHTGWAWINRFGAWLLRLPLWEALGVLALVASPLGIFSFLPGRKRHPYDRKNQR